MHAYVTRLNLLLRAIPRPAVPQSDHLRRDVGLPEIDNVHPSIPLAPRCPK